MCDTEEERLIRFELRSRYYSTVNSKGSREQWPRESCLDAMCSAFSPGHNERTVYEAAMRHHPDGLDILCRDAQFGRFMAERHKRFKGVNGMKDLNPTRVFRAQVFPPSLLEEAAKDTGVGMAQVRKVFEFLDAVRGSNLEEQRMFPSSIMDWTGHE